METSKYTQEWFKNRALSSIKPLGEGKWDFSDSLLMYVPQATDDYEELQAEGGTYYELVTKPEREYLQAIALQVAAELPDTFEYIDLGPGTEHKEQFLFDALKALGKTFTYVPVDISEHFLSLANKHASEQGIPSKSILGSFEELPTLLGSSDVPRFVSIGLTFSNYAPSELFALLKDVAGKGGVVFINSHMRDRTDMERLREAYEVDARSIALAKFGVIGVDASKDVETRTDEGVESWGKVLNVPEAFATKGVKVGDELLVFRSLRYTKTQLEQTISDSFKKFKLFDTGSSFIGALLWTE